MPLIWNVFLAKSVLMPIGLTAAPSAADADTHKKMLGSGFTTLIMSNEEMNDTMKIVKTVEDSDSLIKGVSKTIKNEAKNIKENFSECY